MKKTNSESSPAIDGAFLNIIEAHKNGRVITDISAALKQVTAAEAIDGLRRLDGSIEEYKANPPADATIGCTAQEHKRFPKGRW